CPFFEAAIPPAGYSPRSRPWFRHPRPRREIRSVRARLPPALPRHWLQWVQLPTPSPPTPRVRMIQARSARAAHRRSPIFRRPVRACRERLRPREFLSSPPTTPWASGQARRLKATTLTESPYELDRRSQ